MSIKLISDSRFVEIAEAIANPLRSYTSGFPEFSPLEFEHFCVKVLAILGYEILVSNDCIAPDGGVDFIAKKDNNIIIGQCKKSDWSGKVPDGKVNNISEATVMQHYGLVNIKADNYPDNEIIGYVMTLRKFTFPCQATFQNNPKIKLIDLSRLRDMIFETYDQMANSKKQLLLRPDYDANPWYDCKIEEINIEIKILENLLADAELEYSQLKVKSAQAEQIIMGELIDLFREIALLRTEIEFIKVKLAKNNTDKEKWEEKINQEYIENQEKINQEYQNLENEYIKPVAPLLNEGDLRLAKVLYRELSHKYHPDKHQGFKNELTKIFQAINKNKTNLAFLHGVRDNPHKYFAGIIPEFVDVSKEQLIEYLSQLQKQYEQIQIEIEIILEGDNAKLYQMYYSNRAQFDQVVQSRRIKLQEELSLLRLDQGKLLETLKKSN